MPSLLAFKEKKALNMKSYKLFVFFVCLVFSGTAFADDSIRCSVLSCPEQDQYIPYETVSISYIVTNHTDEVQVLQGLCFPIVRYSVGANGAWHTYTPPSLIQAEPPPPSTTSLAPHMSLQGTFSMDLLDGDSHLFFRRKVPY